MSQETRERGCQRKRKAVDTPDDPSDCDKESHPAKQARLQAGNLPSGLQDSSGDGLKLVKAQGKLQEEPRTDSLHLPKHYNENYLMRKARQRASMQRPKLYLKKKEFCLDVEADDLTTAEDTSKTQVSLATVDLQHLFIYALLGQKFPPPRWCCLLRPGKIANVVLLVLKDVSLMDFQHNQDCFPFLNKTFRNFHRVKFVSPSSYYSSFDLDMYAVPQSCKQVQMFLRLNGHQYDRRGQQVMFPVTIQGSKSDNGSSGDMDSTSDKICTDQKAFRNGKNTVCDTGSSGDKNTSGDKGLEGDRNTTGDKNAAGDKGGAGAISQLAEHPFPVSHLTMGNIYRSEMKTCTRCQLLLSASQLASENYPMPAPNKKDDGFVFSKSRYEPVTDQSPLFAVDCEMVHTAANDNELAWVSIVNEKNEVIYDELVKPRTPIINYLTKYSGITRKMLAPVTKRLEDVQRDISNLLPPDAILCGQSLCFDLKALKLYHPYIIDTSVIYNLSGNRRIKCGLKRLSLHFLGRSIQDNPNGHCPSEDASATMNLIKFKLTKSLNYGDSVLGGITFPCVPTFLGNERQSYRSAGDCIPFTPGSTPYNPSVLASLLPFLSASAMQPPLLTASTPTHSTVPPTLLAFPQSAAFPSPLVAYPSETVLPPQLLPSPSAQSASAPVLPSSPTPAVSTPSIQTLTQTTASPQASLAENVESSVKQKQNRPKSERYQVNAAALEPLRKAPKVDLSKVHQLPQLSSAEEDSVQSIVLMRSLFDLIMGGNMEISASLIGRQDLVTRYKDEQGLICIQKDNDKKVCKKARSICQIAKFSWVEFCAFSDLIQSQELAEERGETSEEEKKGVFKKLDKYVKKVVKKLPQKSLVTVVMPGRRDEGEHHLTAAALFNIT